MSIHLSPRDMAGATILAEQYGAPMDAVAAMLGVGLNGMYRIASKWQRAHLISKRRVRPVPGPSWIFPTKVSAEMLLGRAVRYWVPTPMMAAHTKAVFELRTALTGMDLDRWISERLLRAEVGLVEAGQSRPHIHDGRYYTSGGDLWAVEVELSPKDPRAARSAVFQALQVARQADCAGLTYYCRGDEVKNVIRSAAKGLDLSSGPKLTLLDLEEVIHPRKAETAGKSGLRVIKGGVEANETADAAPHHENGKAIGS
ncbi:hypothetical protein AB0L82_26190 [Nocardia sp. NPDC052001]|uniref:hypothetical protein n=1 Tax=Nocardia sp. NPDC052001 TaxID=3154853 RepID=UPI0034279819